MFFLMYCSRFWPVTRSMSLPAQSMPDSNGQEGQHMSQMITTWLARGVSDRTVVLCLLMYLLHPYMN